MKKYQFCLCLAFSALLFAACQKEENDVAATGPVVTRYIGAELPLISKATLDAPQEGGVAYVKWSEGDAIGVVVSGTNTVRKATLVSGAGTTSATFSVAGAEEGEAYSYAVYPYKYAGSSGSSAPTVDGDVISVTLPLRQPFAVEDGAFVDKVFAKDVNTMVGKFDGEGNVKLKSLCGIFEVPLKSSETSLWSIQLTSDSQKLSGEATIDMSGTEPVLTMGTTTDSFHYVYHQASADIANTPFKLNASTPRSVYFVVPAGTYDDLRISTYVGATSTALKSKKSHTAAPQVIKRFPAYDPAALDKDLETGATELCVNPDGDTEYANCYLAAPSSGEGRYHISLCFSDGTKKFKYPSGADYISAVTPAHFFPFWESEDGLITRIRRVGDDIWFGVKPGARGNALLTAGASSLAATYYFWHIWISDAKPQELVGGTTWLNCNLGAMYAPASKAELEALSAEQVMGTMGLFYRWGNPFPVPGSDGKAYDGSGTAQVFSSNTFVLHPYFLGKYGQKWTASTVTTNALLQYPNYFYSKGGAYCTHVTFKNCGSNALWQSSSKTMFDPCPPGYRIPSREEIGDAFTNSTGSTGKTYTPYWPDTEHWTYLGGSCLSGTGANGSFIFLPWAGIRTNLGVEANTGKTEFIGRLINTWTTKYHRFYTWYAEPSYTEESIAAINKAIRYGNGTGGSDISAANSADYGALTYPVMLYETNNDNGSTGDPFMDGFKLFVSAGANVRCVAK